MAEKLQSGDLETRSDAALLQLFNRICDAEALLWQHSACDVSGSSDLDWEYHLLRKSKALSYIHGYFRNFESRKCCLNLAAGRSSLSAVRVVPSAASSSEVEEGAMRKQRTPAPQVNVLSRQEFQVYHKCILISNFPILAVPSLPQDVASPLTSDPISSAHRLRPSSRSSGFSLGDSLSMGSEPDDVDISVIPSETLCELVRQAFGLSKEKNMQYQKVVFERYGKKSDAKILCEELAHQLAVLENHKNSFYNQQSFQSRLAYESWQISERKHISDLINKFWHISLPPVKNLLPDNQSHHHDNYQFLLQRLLCYEKGQRVETELSSTLSVSSLLSCASLRLLREFALRHGIGELFCKLVYLEFVAEHFENELWYIRHTTQLVAAILELFPSNRTKAMIVKTEHNRLNLALDVILGQCKNSLTRIKRLFQYTEHPQEGVYLNEGPQSVVEILYYSAEFGMSYLVFCVQTASLIDLLCISLSLREYVNSAKDTPVGNLLYEYIQVNMRTGYERHKIIGVTDLGLDPLNTVVTPKLLNKLMTCIRDEVNGYKSKYQAVFERYFDISSVSAQTFYGLLMEDVNMLCQQKSQSRKERHIDLTMISLMYRLDQLDEDWSFYIPTHCQVWRPLFLDEMKHCFNVLLHHVRRLVLQVIAVEKFELVTLKKEDSSTNSWSSSIRANSAVSFMSLTPSTHSAFSSVRSNSKSNLLRKPSLGPDAGDLLHLEEIPVSAPAKLHEHLTTELANACNVHSVTDKGKVPFGKPSVFTKRKSAADLHDKFSLPERRCHSVSLEVTAVETETCIDDVISLQNSVPEKSSVMMPKASSSANLTYRPAVSPNQSSNTEQASHNVSSSVQPDLSNDCDSNMSTSDTESSISSDSDTEQSEQSKSYPQLTVDSASCGWQSTSWQSASCEFSATNIAQCTDDTEITSREEDKKYSLENDTVLHALRNIKESTAKNCSPGHNTPELAATGSFVDPDKPDATTAETPLLVSCSAFDIVALLLRVLHFAKTVFSTLMPKSESDTLPSVEELQLFFDQKEFVKELAEVVNTQLLKALGEVLSLYADNLLSFDLCGTPASTVSSIMEKQLRQHLHKRKSHDQIWGCRHMTSDKQWRRKDCSRFVKKDSELLCDKHEPVTQEMCTRINNLREISLLVDSVYEKAANLFSSLTEPHQPTFSTPVQEERVRCTGHLKTVCGVLIKLLSHKIHCYFHDGFVLLLDLDLPGISVKNRFHPLTSFLSNHLAMLPLWLHKSSYVETANSSWDNIVMCVKDVVHKLREQKNNPRHKASTILNVIAELISCMAHHGKYLDIDNISSKMEQCTFHLQLYMMSTPRLITMFNLLRTQTHCSTGTSTPQTLLPSSEQLEEMRHRLHSQRKVFSGYDLVSWLRTNMAIPNSSQDSCSVEDFCHQVAQKLLDTDIIACVDQYLHSSQSSEVEGHAYPDLLCCSTASGSFKDSISRLGVDFQMLSRSLKNENVWVSPSDSLQNLHAESDSDGAMTTDERDDVTMATVGRTGVAMATVGSSSHIMSIDDCNRNIDLPTGDDTIITRNGNKENVAMGTDGCLETENRPADDSCVDEHQAQDVSTPSAISQSDSYGTNSSDLSKFLSTTHNFYLMKNISLEDFEQFSQLETPENAPSEEKVKLSKAQMLAKHGVTAEFVLGIIAGRQKQDNIAGDFIRELPLHVLEEYPWLLLYKQSIFSCFGF